MRVPFVKFGIDIDALIRWHRLDAENRGKMPLDSPTYAKLAANMPPMQWYNGVPNKWQFKDPTFTLQLTNSGKVHYWYKGGAPAVVASRLYTYLTVTCGLTWEEFQALVASLQLMRLEAESLVSRNDQGVLHAGIGAYIEYPPESVLGEANLVIKFDESPGKYILCWETGGESPEAADLQELAARPVAVEGNLRKIRNTQLEHGKVEQQLVSAVEGLRADLTLENAETRKVAQQPWAALGTLNRSFLRLEQGVAQVADLVSQQDPSDVAPDLTETNQLLTQVRDAIYATATYNAATIDSIEQKLDTHEANSELRDAEDAERHAHYDLQNQIRQEAMRDRVKYTERRVTREIKAATNEIVITGAALHAQVMIRLAAAINGLKGVQLTVESLAARVGEIEAKLETLHHDVIGIPYKIRKNMKIIYAEILALFERIPELTAAQVASVLGVKPNKAHYYLARLKLFGLLERAKKVPDTEPQGEISAEIPGRPERMSAPKRFLRKCYHYFLNRKLENKPTTESEKPDG